MVYHWSLLLNLATVLPEDGKLVPKHVEAMSLTLTSI